MTPLPSTHAFDTRAHVQRLLIGRGLFILAVGLLIAGVPGWLDLHLPRAAMLALLGVLAAHSLLVQRQLRHDTPPTEAALFRHLLLDLLTLSLLVFLSGGVTNPLIALLLPPVAYAALTLPARLAGPIAGLAIVAYSLLLGHYLPLTLDDPARGTQLHLIGMWLGFALSAALMVGLILFMMARLRERDAALATAREQALRDERVLALGTLAAGAAHALGSPLGTMSLICGELARDPALPGGARADVEVLREQLAACKQILTDLSRQAGVERLENPLRQPVDRWLHDVRERWAVRHPDLSCTIDCPPAAPALNTDPRLAQALVNLLDNAARASRPGGRGICLRARWTATHLTLSVEDDGPGFAPGLLAQAGQSPLPTADGQGIGLLLTRTAIEQLGGRLHLANRPDGGALAALELPR